VVGALTSVVGLEVMGALVPPGLVALSLTRIVWFASVAISV
jgi:hypothetical protein